jgi:hypothetical protein
MSFASVGAQSAPASNPFTGMDASNIILVAQGCGPGWHRNTYGVCRPNRPPVVVAPRVCPRGYYLSGRGVCVRRY